MPASKAAVTMDSDTSGLSREKSLVEPRATLETRRPDLPTRRYLTAGAGGAPLEEEEAPARADGAPKDFRPPPPPPPPPPSPPPPGAGAATAARGGFSAAALAAAAAATAAASCAAAASPFPPPPFPTLLRWVLLPERRSTSSMASIEAIGALPLKKRKQTFV